ncbi:MAG: methyltransferase domain-containing protein [Nitrospirae bacterium]|nr:methyltransferase domain-containing protein [Fimbriimonadaceae bacterium]
MRFSPMTGLPDYFRNPRPEVLQFVPSETRTALDVGCAAGAFGLALRSEFGAEVWGIEMNPEAAAFAQERLDRVAVGDAMELLPEMPHAKFDLVTFTDVLEHLAWPQRALELARPLLTPKGCVLASIPNIRCWVEFRKLVLGGDFPTEDAGIFDRTHLRFFTKKSIPRLLGEAGFQIERIAGINERYSRFLRLANLATRGRLDDARYLQFVVLARPCPEKG